MRIVAVPVERRQADVMAQVVIKVGKGAPGRSIGPPEPKADQQKPGLSSASNALNYRSHP